MNIAGKRGKKAAIELSIGTIVIIVLAMSMLILGLVLVRSIFSGSTDAIGEINKGVINEINKLFTDSDKKIVIYPSTRQIEIKQGDQKKGFAFAVRNNAIDEKSFTYEIKADENFKIQDKCKIDFNEANSWLILNTGSFTLGPGKASEQPELILLNIPEEAPPCTIPYKIDIRQGDQFYVQGKIYLTIIPS